MTSQQEIYNKLTEIANSYNMQGDAVEMQKDWLSFLFANQSTEVVNAFMESNLVTASLMNDKITQCMSVMYSVYRGKNAKLKLKTYTSNTILNVDKYQLVYQSNNFYLYANDAYTIDRQNNIECEFIISTKPKYVVKRTINEDNRFYFDVILNNKMLGDLSEDLRVFIDGVEYKTTRLFYKHINQSSNLTQSEINNLYESNDFSKVDKEDALFALTIPDYGIRLFKKGYFKVASEVQVECFHYTSKSELVDNYSSEIKRIKFNGFDMLVSPNADEWMDENGNFDAARANYIMSDIERDSLKSLLYNAVAYNHVQSQIMSNTDVDTIFLEYFRDFTVSADHVTSQLSTDNNDWSIVIYYIPLELNNLIRVEDVEGFKSDYASYYINQQDLIVIPAQKLQVTVECKLIINSSNSLDEEFDKIFAEYASKLPKINKITVGSNGNINVYKDISSVGVEPILNFKQLYADISNLPTVKYIDKLELIGKVTRPGITGTLTYIVDINNIDKLVELLYTTDELGRLVPTYFEFLYNISYELQ